MAAATQYVLYSNDAVDVAFCDGAHLFLSPCGSSFCFQRAPSDCTHSSQRSAVQQRCQFATSEFRPYVVDALDFRNRFAERPFICKELLNPEQIVKLHADITEIAWPSELTHQQVETLEDGSVVLTSQDEYATVTLAANHKLFTVRYLAKVSQKHSRHSIEKGEERWDYVWMVQYHSVQQSCPHWHRPLQLLLDFLSKPASNTPPAGSNHKPSDSLSIRRILKKDFRGCMFSQPPRSLTLNCGAQHLHKWPHLVENPETAYLHGRVTVISIQAVIYRLLWEQHKAVEIYPGDGSILVSSGLAGKFFTHYLVSKSGQLHERMYSVDSPPPVSTSFTYNVGKLITRAARFLQHICEESLQLVVQPDICCWQQPGGSTADTAPSTRLLEECVVGGVGKFLAYSNGHIRVLFTDRTSLDMNFDPSSRLKSQKQEGPEAGRLLDLQDGMCRLLLRSGHYHSVSVDQPAPYDKYVKAAVEWKNWVTSDPGQRSDFYKDTLYDPEKVRSVQTELKKIQCFNFILENSLLAKFSPLIAANQEKVGQVTEVVDTRSSDDLDTEGHQPGDCDKIDLSTIQEVLKKTSAAVRSIDNFLGLNGQR